MAPRAKREAVAGTIARIIETSQTVLTGLILAFVFRAYQVEPFMIPTGSMAESLCGAHSTQLCRACGWEYNADFSTTDADTRRRLRPDQLFCPNCHLRSSPEEAAPTSKSGDRILVHKWCYDLPCISPQPWEVIVFRDPANPLQNYIKRLVGLPGETIEIVDGDVYVNGCIRRKTPAAQSVLWSVVFDQSYPPAPDSQSGRTPRWIVDEEPGAASGWFGLDSRVFRFQPLDGRPHAIRFNAEAGREYLLDVLGYNRGSSGTSVSDLRLGAAVKRDRSAWLEFELTRGPHVFILSIIGERVRLRHRRTDVDPPTDATIGDDTLPGSLSSTRFVQLEHVDYRVTARIDGREFFSTSDDQYAPDLPALRRDSGGRTVSVRISAAGGSVSLERLRIDRDVHYTYTPGRTRRAYAAHPFVLAEREYFVLGDNSADSHDSREWSDRSVNLNDGYRLGTVRFDQIVGRAAFVYLPGLVPVWSGTSARMPDLGRMRFIR